MSMRSDTHYDAPFKMWHAVLAIGLASLVVRLMFFAEYTFAGIGRDTAGYLSLATNIASGQGWVNPSLRFLYLLPDALPQPDNYWSPLFPLCIAGVFKLFGAGFASARLVPMCFGVMLPPLLFLLTRDLSRSWKAGLAAGGLAVFHPTLVMWSIRVQPEILTMFFTSLSFYLAVNPRFGKHSALAGAAIGLAYLAKYQNGFLLPAIALFYFLNYGWREGFRQSVVLTLAFIVMVSPWLIRNTIVFGDPLSSAVRSMLLSYMPGFGGEARMVASLEPPPPTLPYVLEHPVAMLKHAKGGFLAMAPGFLQDHRGSMWMFPLVALGFVSAAGAWRRWTPVVFLTALVVAVFCMTVPIVRYLLGLTPLWICIAGAGAGWLMDMQKRRVVALVVAIALVSAAATGEYRFLRARTSDKASLWTPSANFGQLEALSIAEFIQENTDSTEVVMAAETYHYAYIMKRSAAQMPYDEEVMRFVRDKYDIRFLVTSLRDLRKRLPSWEPTPPSWVRLVHTVKPDDIKRPKENPDYPHVSEMRVYRIDGDKDAE